MSAGNPPAALTGREEQIEQFKLLLGRLAIGRTEQSLIVSGMRGVGKTVLLLEFESIAEREGWTSAEPIEIRSDTNFRSELGGAVYEVLMRLDRRRALGERLKRFLGLLERFRAGLSTDGSVEFSIDTGRRGEDDALERDLKVLLIELGEVARAHGTVVVLLVDEMQFLARDELEAIAAAMHRLTQRKLPVALAGTGLPQLPALMVEAKSYAERLFSYPRLGALGSDAAQSALVQPAEAEGVRFDDDALERIVALSGGYPTFIQAYGREAWNVAPTERITLADVRACEAIVQSRLDEAFFAVRFEKATPRERRYMAAMADIGDGPHRRSEVADRLGSTLTATSAVRDALIKKGLIYSPDHGIVDFTVPHFAPFMRRRYPLAEEGE